jgi:formylglycine-generating enzyme
VEPGPTPAPSLAMPAAPDGGSDAAGEPPKPATEISACPSGMAHVKREFCTEMERTCRKSEYDKANHITICHRFMETQRCTGRRIPLDFCIDHYEYPNKKGEKPPVMVDWYDATGLCAAQGKRLCYESEWTAACEGPNETPFPHGHARSAEKCNIDNAWVNPSLKKIYSKNEAESRAELARLDRSVPSGAKPECVSGYGVYDLTGNVDEWTIADRDRPEERAVFVALKGGAWGHVRNACRPVTTSHEPEFTYYFVSFRCCKDAAKE